MKGLHAASLIVTRGRIGLLQSRCRLELLPVAQFDEGFLPRSISPWVLDIADRMQ